ncbi:MAG: wax ester/triacylglycerol synthase family O-acyltransferase [Halieaceae bacterium]|jgi:WS/DGAT/MGAT family acyltransferase|nr:wax ester/triacylglycerol synthase family O-acyltransferase [Halieaceae bacterium]
MSRLSILDLSFLVAERRNTPMHVGGLNLFQLPKGANRDEFLRELLGSLRSSEPLQRPFCDRLQTGVMGSLAGAHWVHDDELDLEYHVRHSALPSPGRYRELFALVSRLHGTLLDRSRPLWEMHLIEGVNRREFALYSKYHHAVIDGVRGVHLVRSMFSTSPEEIRDHSPLSVTAQRRYESLLSDHGMRIKAPPEINRGVVERFKAQLDLAGDIYSRTRKQLSAVSQAGIRETLMPWSMTPRSALNAPIDGSRRFVAQSFDVQRFLAVKKHFGCTLNDAVLAACSGALVRYLEHHAELPEKPLRALVPISLRKPGDLESANAVGGIIANLATDIRDPAQRLAKISESMRHGKAIYDDMSAAEAAALFALMQSQNFILSALQLTRRLPAISTTISNVPGPREQMFWNGAPMTGYYPASIVLDGFALNITLISYYKTLDFGITACRRSVPQAQRLIEYLEEALQELEVVAGLRGGDSHTRRRTPARPKTRRKQAA